MSRLSHYVPGFIHPRWFAWLLPSTVVKPTGHPRVCRCPHPGNAGLPRLLTLHQSGACSIWQDGIWELFSSEKQGDCIFLSLHEVSWTSGHGFFPNIIFLATWKQQKKTIKNPGSLFGTWPKKQQQSITIVKSNVFNSRSSFDSIAKRAWISLEPNNPTFPVGFPPRRNPAPPGMYKTL